MATDHELMEVTGMRINRKRALLAALLWLAAAGGAAAVDSNEVTDKAPDLTEIRALIKAKEYAGALVLLNNLAQRIQNPDIYNLMGFAYRKSGDIKQGATYYAKALDFDPDHKGALEYQGEMYVQLGEIEKAKANLAKLVRLCPSGCEEREDLEKAIAGAAGKAAPK
jgi:tetratricopeptide (TPR) repeat protein